MLVTTGVETLRYGPNMSKNVDVVREAFAAWEQGNSGPLFKAVAADVSWRVIGTTPLSGTHHGKVAFRDATQPFTERLAEPIVAKVLAVHDVGDTVIVQWEGTSKGTNGRPYNQSYCWVMHLTDAKIDNVVAYLDTALVNDIFT